MTDKKKYWYFIIIQECPVCGRGETYKERRYTPKPEARNLRYEYVEYYDHCEEY